MELVQYLTGYGHKDIVVMGGEISDKQISFSRYLGCKKGFEKSGLEFDPDKNYNNGSGHKQHCEAECGAFDEAYTLHTGV